MSACTIFSQITPGQIMRILTLFLFSYFTLCNAFSQAVKPGFMLKGVVVDSTGGKALAYVTIALQDIKTRTSLKSVLSRDDGTFQMPVPANKNYQLAFAFTGYRIKIIPVPDKDADQDFGTIGLSVNDKQLNEVTVVALRPVIKRDLDGITYDVAADPESPALTALDMMRKVPLLSLDASDNIKLKGQGNYKIFINGKESALLAKNPSDVLRSMPATNIEKIEVITTPPAKYDAEGLAGIINIITKKNMDQGYNIGINGRYNSVWGPGLNVNGTFKQGKFGLSGYVGYNIRPVQTNGFGNSQTFFADNSSLAQNGTNSTRDGHNNYGNAELSYEFDSLNLLTGSLEYYRGGNNQNGSQLSTSLDGNDAITQEYRLQTLNSITWEGIDAALNYQRGFKTDKNRLLTISYKYSYSPNSSNVSNIITDTFNYNLPDYQQYNNAGNKEHTIQVDYAQPIKRVTLEAGGKLILRDNFSNFHTSNYNDSLKDYLTDSLQTNDFHYKQNIYSLYNSYQIKWDKWNVKAGLRLEHTTVNADFVSESSTVQQNYNNLVPSISIQRNLKSSSVTLGYTDRISRPTIYQINPFVDQTNPKFVNTGNPHLQPETNHSFELNYSSFGKTSVNIGLSYAFSNNSIQTVTGLQVDSTNHMMDTVTVTTYQNLGSNKTLGMNFSVSFTVISNLSVSLNGQLAHVWLKGIYNDQFFKNDGYTGNAFMNAGYKFGKGYRFGIDAGYFSGDVNLQGGTSPYVFTSYVFSKTFLNKKLTLSAVMNNPYSRYFTFTTKVSTPDFYQSSYNDIFYRSFAIRVNFKFGKLNSDIKRNEHGINNDDKKGGKTTTPNQ
jgi:hypothetical protein